MKIVLDAGHGPETPGKRTPDGSMREYQFNRVVANYAAEELRRYGAEILFTHSDDRDVPLKERTGKANAWGADLLVSIHANAYGSDGWNDVGGIETFVYTTKPPAALKLATAIQQTLIRVTGLATRGVKTANFHMLRESKMTAVLVECGFMTNRKEAELLKSDEYRRKCASAIVEAIAKTYGLTEQESDGMYRDVKKGSWYEKSVEKAHASGVMVGINEKEFGVGQPVTREQLAVILDRLGMLDK